MKKAIFVLMSLYLFIVYSVESTDEKTDANAFEVREQENKAVPVQVQQQDDKFSPVEVHSEAGQEFPVKIEVGGNNPLPSELSLKDSNALTVKGEGQTDKWFYVKLERDYVPLILSILATGATVVIAIVTLFTAKTARESASAAQESAQATHESAEATKMTVEGQLFFNFITEYSSRETRDDLHTLWNWDREKVGTDKSKRDEEAQKWIEEVYKKKNNNAIEMDKARRHITHYFLHILDLEESGYVKEGFAKTICEAVGTGILDVAFPLEKATVEFIGQNENWNLDQIKEQVERLNNKFEKLKKLSSYARFRH